MLGTWYVLFQLSFTKKIIQLLSYTFFRDEETGVKKDAWSFSQVKNYSNRARICHEVILL